MKVDMLFFGVARELAGNRTLKFDFPQNTTVGTIRAKIEEKFPSLADLNRYAVAVNNEYAADDILINDGDEIAILPPVSGG